MFKWCFPDGIRIYDENLEIINEKNLSYKEIEDTVDITENPTFFKGYSKDFRIEKKNQIYSFVATDENY